MSLGELKISLGCDEDKNHIKTVFFTFIAFEANYRKEIEYAIFLSRSTENYQKMQSKKNYLISLLQCMVVQIHVIFDWIVDFIFYLYYRNEEYKYYLPSINDSLLVESTVDLAEKIRNRNVSAEQVVCTFINRCKEINLLLNVVVDERYMEAIEEAKKIDQFLNTASDADLAMLQSSQPLLGVPFTTKESNEVEGLLHSVGMLARKNYRSKEDATAIRLLKNAGAIVIAKTNIPELNLWVESRNLIYGQSNNPYNITRTVGGSSGGDAALVAACGAPFALGSDIGGSIRMPAFFNGVFGLKPSFNCTPMKGIGLRNIDYSDSMAEAGPICRHAKDLTALLRIITTRSEVVNQLDTTVDVKKLKIFYQDMSGDLRVSRINKNIRYKFQQVISYFHDLSGLTQKIKIPNSEYSFRLWRYWMSQEPNTDFKLDITNRSYRTDAISEIKKLICNKSEVTGAAILKLIDEDFFPKDKKEWAESITNNMKEYLLTKLGNDGVLLFPSSPNSAGYHYSYFFKPYNFSYWALCNVLRFPTCQIPLGLDNSGMPIGIQVIAAPHHDHLCIAVAQDLERAFGGYVLPPSG